MTLGPVGLLCGQGKPALSFPLVSLEARPLLGYAPAPPAGSVLHPQPVALLGAVTVGVGLPASPWTGTQPAPELEGLCAQRAGGTGCGLCPADGHPGLLL